MDKYHILHYQTKVQDPTWIRSLLQKDCDFVIHSIASLSAVHQSLSYHPYCLLYECDALHLYNLKELKALANGNLPCLILAITIDPRIPASALLTRNIILKPYANSSVTAFANMLRINIRFIKYQIKEKALPKQEGFASNGIIAFGASTGGPHALATILKDLPPWMCGIVIVQHISDANTDAFANYLDRMCQMKVIVAKEATLVRQGVIYIAKQQSHLILKRNKDGYYLHYHSGPKVHSVCPSIDVLFQSLAATHDKGSIAILLTGMGIDGAQGLLAVKKAGLCTIIQDEASCELYGMPKEAKRLQAYDLELSLTQITAYLLQRYAYLTTQKGEDL